MRVARTVLHLRPVAVAALGGGRGGADDETRLSARCGGSMAVALAVVLIRARPDGRANGRRRPPAVLQGDVCVDPEAHNPTLVALAQVVHPIAADKARAESVNVTH